MKPQCNTSAECLRELARVMDQFGYIDLMEAVNSKHVKFNSSLANRETLPLFQAPEFWQFAIAEVEGKPVFVGDELYTKDGNNVSINSYAIPNILYTNSGSFYTENLSWNPPRPKTVMIELTVEDANCWSNLIECNIAHKPSTRLYEACKTALEKLK